ncbi:hypothetical protein EYF80_047403 [Liparis tanakae]|uniref:Uncharacterized protein n=1 Tax=Liparis tanakae TaxID=230148 RepID=A0A4Z2FNR5_9TELE|nr:hypothetical protein EYF80_047403 [Liparis tanakae]
MTCSGSSLSSGCGRNPLVDLLLGGGEGNVALRVGAHVELVDLRQEEAQQRLTLQRGNVLETGRDNHSIDQLRVR